VPACRSKTFELYEQGALRAVVDEHTFPSLERTVDAVDFMLSGQALGKVVVSI